MNLNWLFSRNARIASDMRKHVRKILDAQRDLLTPVAITAVEDALRDLKAAVDTNATENDLKDRMTDLENAANKWLKPYPNAGIRENVEVLLVALAVAMGIRTFIVQPFKIPTGSMQPTLFGVSSENLRNQPDAKPPGLLSRLYQGIVMGTFYHYQVAEADGVITGIEPDHFLKFINTFRLTVHYAGRDKDSPPYTFWMTPEEHVEQRAALRIGQTFRKGEPIVDFKEVAGDHLFVDRISYNFRRPTRGEIIVFETRGIAALPQDQFYIKRMVALGGEKVQIGDDRHLVINGQRLDKNTPHFENVYSFNPVQRAADSHYSGHLNQTIAYQDESLRSYNIAPLFPNQDTIFEVPPDHYMVMGDNTANSYDSRAWGDFSRTNVIGKYFFVYWPFTQRFGWSLK